ncbi:hypothetical protein VNO77_44024 [Canavalia gladiata]|uniref:Uncharacterized protein n=1 Tax=Canavalia gladiata TaxID=3824 RepID=A0AAN9JXG5_CANGL
MHILDFTWGQGYFARRACMWLNLFEVKIMGCGGSNTGTWVTGQRVLHHLINLLNNFVEDHSLNPRDFGFCMPLNTAPVSNSTTAGTVGWFEVPQHHPSGCKKAIYLGTRRLIQDLFIPFLAGTKSLTLIAGAPASLEIYLWPRTSRNLLNVFPTILDVTMENRKPPERPGEFPDGEQLLLLSPSSSSFPLL